MPRPPYIQSQPPTRRRPNTIHPWMPCWFVDEPGKSTRKTQPELRSPTIPVEVEGGEEGKKKKKSFVAGPTTKTTTRPHHFQSDPSRRVAAAARKHRHPTPPPPIDTLAPRPTSTTTSSPTGSRLPGLPVVRVCPTRARTRCLSLSPSRLPPACAPADHCPHCQSLAPAPVRRRLPRP